MLVNIWYSVFSLCNQEWQSHIETSITGFGGEAQVSNFVSTFLDCMSYFPVVVIKCPQQKQLKDRRAYFGSHFKAKVHHCGEMAARV